MLQVKVTGVQSGFPELDQLTGGFQPGQLIFIASRYSVGKTALALNIVEHMTICKGLPVAMFCLASSTSDLKMRLASSISGVRLRDIKTKQLSGQDWRHLHHANDAIQGSKLHLEGNVRVSVNELSDRVRWLSDQHGKMGLIVVDDLQCTYFSAKRGRAVADEIDALSCGLKSLAQEHCCPVIVPTQLGRAMEVRRDKRPRLTDLRLGGRQEQEADMIMSVYRDDYYNFEVSTTPGIAEIGVLKNLNGTTGCVNLVFNKAHARFENLTHTIRTQ